MALAIGGHVIKGNPYSTPTQNYLSRIASTNVTSALDVIVIIKANSTHIALHVNNRREENMRK